MRLIDADKIKLPQGFFEKVDNVPKFYEWLDKQPTVDAVEVVRCKDCKHKPRIIDVFHASYGDVPVLESDKCPCVNKDDYFYSHMPDDDWFCGNGERREDATD